MTVLTRALMTGALATTLLVAGTALTAEPSVERGKKLFNTKAQCKTCHSVKAGVKRVGPSVFGTIGRKCGTAKKTRFSKGYKEACKKAPWTWDADNLDKYLEDPGKFVTEIRGKKSRSPMTRKTKKAADRADIIAYIKTLK